MKNEFDRADITLHVNEDITCCEGFTQLYDKFMSWKPMGGNADDQEHWTVQMYICKFEIDETKAGNKRGEEAGSASGPSSNGEGKGGESSPI